MNIVSKSCTYYRSVEKEETGRIMNLSSRKMKRKMIEWREKKKMTWKKGENSAKFRREIRVGKCEMAVEKWDWGSGKWSGKLKVVKWGWVVKWVWVGKSKFGNEIVDRAARCPHRDDSIWYFLQKDKLLKFSPRLRLGPD